MSTRKYLLLMVALCFAGPTLAANGNGNGKNGTTLAAYKTLDICVVDPLPSDANGTLWRYSGEVAVWNEGSIPTSGFSVEDVIQSKAFGSGTQFVDTLKVPATAFDFIPVQIPSGTTQTMAVSFRYSLDAGPMLDAYIRNSVKLTIVNHSGAPGVATGPNPKFTYTGSLPPRACPRVDEMGCVYTQGYWGNKPDVVWPDPYSRMDIFYLSKQTWQQVFDTPVNVSQGYYQLAHQFMAARLNIAKTDKQAFVPDGVMDTLNVAETWLITNEPSACTGGGSCGLQKDWAKVLDSYNNGLYSGGPKHCE